MSSAAFINKKNYYDINRYCEKSIQGNRIKNEKEGNIEQEVCKIETYQFKVKTTQT